MKTVLLWLLHACVLAFFALVALDWHEIGTIRSHINCVIAIAVMTAVAISIGKSDFAGRWALGLSIGIPSVALICLGFYDPESVAQVVFAINIALGGLGGWFLGTLLRPYKKPFYIA